MENAGKEKKKLSFIELRIIGISLAVLSLGLAIAYLGLFWVMQDREGERTQSEKAATSSGKLK